MTKKLLLPLIIVLFTTTVDAQYVDIPDFEFKIYLMTRYPACFTFAMPPAVEKMDTTCSDIINEDSLTPAYYQLTNIQGIEYFKNLKYLNIEYTKFSVWSPLPNTLRHLQLNNTPVATLPVLNDSLRYLDISLTKITHIDSLPSQLENLIFQQTPIDTLPPLPKHLKELSMRKFGLWWYTSPFYPRMPLSKVPDLPNSLETLSLNGGTFTTLPILPNSIKDFHLINSLVSHLPELPASLNNLDLTFDSNLVCLPRLPDSLKTIWFDSTIKCMQNHPANLVYGASYQEQTPLCNPTNNINHCQFSPIVYGKVFTDNNLNGIKDTNEFYKSKVKLKLTSNNKAIFTDANGSYTSQIDSIGSYTLKVEVPPLYSVVSDSINFNFTVFDTVYILPDIALQPNTVKDSLSLNITPINWRARPGFSFPYIISYENVGTTTISPTINFNYDSSKLIYDSSSIIVTNTSNNLSLNVGSMVPGATNSFIAYFRVKSAVPIGDTVVVTGTATYAENARVVSFVGGSFDPNDKQATPVLTPVQVALGKYIDYTIRFQNTGNDTAFTVVIADTLSSNLQANTLLMVGSSHNCKTTVAGNIVYFEFMNIKLADSVVNEKASHGFVSFKIKPKTTLTNGNTVSNKAFIYFDYNAAVATNTAITQINTSGIVTPVRFMNYEVRFTNEGSQFPSIGGVRGGSILNTWTTSSEINTSYFIIQRSDDGRVFKSVGTVAAKGNGTYNFIDELKTKDQLPKTLYYRLQIVDKDGSKTYSEIKQIRLNQLTDKQINVYPNPATTLVNIDCIDAKQILIVDYLGRIIKQFNNTTAHQTINTQQLNKGIYVVKAITNRGEVKTAKLIVE